MSKRKTHEEFIMEKELLGALRHIDVLSKYISNKTKMDFYCTIHDCKFSKYPSNFLRSYGCKFCGYVQLSISKTKSHEEYVDRVKQQNPHLTILGIYNGCSEKVRVRCTRDEYEWDAIANTLITETNVCPLCNTHVVVKGVNDLATTHNYLSEWVLNKDNMYTRSHGSAENIGLICPDCGYEFSRKINKVCGRGVSCPRCGDSRGTSFPEKILMNLFIALGARYKKDAKFIFSGDKKYDYYLEDDNVICEIHGSQHYDKSTFSRLKDARTFEEEQDNDRLKYDLICEYMDCRYIVIDARYSDVNFIKQNIIDSELSKVFDLSMIDWNEIFKRSLRSKVKDVAILYGKNKMLIDIGKELSISQPTVIKYLKNANEVGLCEYKPYKHTRRCICLTTNEVFSSIKEASKKFQVQYTNILSCCNGKINYAGKLNNECLTWAYYGECN